MVHVNAIEHMRTYRKSHRDTYNEYMKLNMRKVRIWKKISMEFLKILL